jgi:phosphatidylglycerol:prolipoprotein diacylglycerol transferase
MSMFELGDVIAPGMAIGLAFGRIGCLMNGCCYGGICDGWPLAITFPQHASAELGQYSPPYAHQLMIGELHGFRIGNDGIGNVIVVDVERDSKAEAAGVKVGTTIDRLNGQAVTDLESAQRTLMAGSPQITINDGDISWTIDQLPANSRPVHPTQIYSSINAALLCLVVWFAYPFRRRHGEILLLLLVLYSIARFLEEAIRNDEAGQLGTSLTISQLVSVGVLVLCIGVWLVRLRQPRIDAEVAPPAVSA